MLLSEVWGMRIQPDTNVVDVHIYRLRGKMDTEGREPLIKTLRGIGYVLKDPNPIMHSAAWRISLWATLAFAIGTMLVFAMLHRFVADDIQRRSDAWLAGEVEVLGDVAERTPKDRLYRRVVGEVAELASREVPNRQRSNGSENDSVFFLQAGDEGLKLWVGAGDGSANLAAIRSTKVLTDVPYDFM